MNKKTHLRFGLMLFFWAVSASQLYALGGTREIYYQSEKILYQNNKDILNLILDQSSQSCGSNSFCFWSALQTGLNAFKKTDLPFDSVKGMNKFSANSKSMTLGADYTFGRQMFKIGLYYSLHQAQISNGAQDQEGFLRHDSVGSYFFFQPYQTFFGEGSGIYFHSSFLWSFPDGGTVYEKLTVPGSTQNFYTDTFRARSFFLNFGLGYDFWINRTLLLTPFAHATWGNYRIEGKNVKNIPNLSHEPPTIACADTGSIIENLMLEIVNVFAKELNGSGSYTAAGFKVRQDFFPFANEEPLSLGLSAAYDSGVVIKCDEGHTVTDKTPPHWTLGGSVTGKLSKNIAIHFGYKNSFSSENMYHLFTINARVNF